MIDKLVNIFDDLTKNSRVEELSQLAEEYHLDFQKRLPFATERTEIKGFKAFGKKGVKRLLGVLSEEAKDFDGAIRFYDFLNTRDLETKTTSVIEIHCKDIYTDYVKIEPKGAFAKMKGFFVSEEKQFEHIDDFYQSFQISTRIIDGDLWLREAALKCFMDFPRITMEAEGNNFIFYSRKKAMPVQDIISTLEFAEEFVRLTCYDQSDDFV